ncbi:uncharacterized protein LOC125222682 isoform X2 [Salvia hispanica]|uniref:uncharacterized protein LOC125197892 isoform X2 n=1 Tax=Salvia hispanica TaxID=49212 RepID=UPI002009BDEB|nr:uncharacterized protein LOC125197892 isoform X2 [Salvia hispanica]XP_047981386.1 uncharacterized protein LOC125222682 isoform X2 [Salvia hispanica]
MLASSYFVVKLGSRWCCCSMLILLKLRLPCNFNRVWWYTKEVLPYGVEDFQKLTCPLWLVEDLGCPAVVLDGLAASGPMG